MAWTTPRTWVPGELVTATMMNTHVRDQLNFLIDGGGNFIGVESGKNLYLDAASGAGGDTYFEEVTANVVRLITGGAESSRWSSTFFRVANDIQMPSAGKFYIDNGSNTYATESTADTWQFVCGGNASCEITTTTKRWFYNGVQSVAIYPSGDRAENWRGIAFDNGAAEGNYMRMGRNSNGSTPAAGFFAMDDRAGTVQYIWPDASGNLRINSATPINSRDTNGTVVGTQTSWHELKREISPWARTDDALRRVLDLDLYSFRFARDGQRGAKRLHGLVVFEDDRSAWWVMNGAAGQTPVLDEANLFGHLIASVQSLAARVAALEGR